MTRERKLIFQLGTNNWQRGGEFAPGSGILHDAHHLAYNALPHTRAYSMYPSRRQTSDDPRVAVFALDHDVPICESVSPSSSLRWHAMSDADFRDYRARLTREVGNFMDAAEDREGAPFGLAIAHHAFLNPLVMRDVIEARVARGKPRTPLLCFVHGTALKMYAHEKRGDDPQYPARFLPMIEQSGLFARRSGVGVALCAAISEQQIDAFAELFPDFSRDRILLSHNGYNQDVFHKIVEPRDAYAERADILASFTTVPYEGSPHAPRSVAPAGGFDKVVLFCGKFADWKRLDCLLRAAEIYERSGRIVTLVVGSGPHAQQVKLQKLAFDELRLRDVFFLGPRSQQELALLYNTADVGCFPSHDEPFGLVFIECMACATPVIGVDSGGPRDFVTAASGELIAENADGRRLAAALAEAVERALREDWKSSRGGAAAELALARFSVRGQCERLLAAVDRRIALDRATLPRPGGDV